MDIASMLEVEVQEVADSKENVTPKPQQTFPCQTYSKEENDFYKLTYGCDIAAVRFLRLHCTACDEHIGSAPSEAHNMHEHPVLRVLLCAKCREFYGDGTFEQGDDATDMFCRWCANGGNLYCCSYCSNTFCSKCIKRNFDFPTIKRIEAEETWKCFVCDPKDLYPLRSIARALICHIETVTRILENNRRMSNREVEEKMHLDETKCCSKKRKRRRRRTLSASDDDNDDDEDVSYVPEAERSDLPPPAKKRRSRCTLVRNTCNSNGYSDHEYNSRRRSAVPKVEPDYDPSDLINQCEQTMIEGDDEIINPSDETNGAPSFEKEPAPPAPPYKVVLPQVQPKPVAPLQLQPLQKIQINNAMGTLNPVPIANLLKVPLYANNKKLKMTSQGSPKLVAVPVQKGTAGISFVKPPMHFLVPKNVTGTLTPIQLQQQQQQQVGSGSQQPPPRLQPIQLQPVQSVEQQPSVIDLDSDNESVIVENEVGSSRPARRVARSNVDVVNEGDAAGENVIPEQLENNSDVVDDEPMVVAQRNSSTSTIPPLAPILPRSKRLSMDSSTITLDGQIPLKTQNRYKRFDKMLKLQSREIDTAVGELKTKILKLAQSSMVTSSESMQDADLQNAAFVCTKRFHRALRKALTELSHINDRLVKDYLHWKKRTDRAEKLSSAQGAVDAERQSVDSEESEETRKERENIPSKKRKKTDDITLEMICERESASESEADDEDGESNENREIEAIDVPADFSSILDHLSLFKRKPTAVKAVGNDSVLTEDKGCQAYDVPWRDYEKCIGYSLLTKSEYDPEKKEEILRSVAQPDENFGKYQEQYLFYLQHVEDYGIETDEAKGLPDPNHIPLKDLIDSSSPFIMDMLERLSPVTLSNGCTTPREDKVKESKTSSSCISKEPAPSSDAAPDCTTDTSAPSPLPFESSKDTDSHADTMEESASEKKSEDPPVATSKAVEELQKMVTKLSEDLRNEQQQSSSSSEASKPIDLEEETLMAVNSILEVSCKNAEEKEDENMDVVEILDLEPVQSDNDDCMTLN